MPQPDIAAIAADVLQKHDAGITPLPWASQRKSSSYIDVHGPGFKHSECSETELAFEPVCRVHSHCRGDSNHSYIVAAANSAPALARQTQADAAALAELRAERDQLRREVESLNEMIRSYGFGQGEINNWASEHQELIADRDRLQSELAAARAELAKHGRIFDALLDR